MHPSNKKTFSLGILVLWIFVLEGIVAKSLIPHFQISTVRHIAFTAGIIVFMILLSPSRQVEGTSYLAGNRSLGAIRFSVGILIFLGLVSCLPQRLLVSNLIFWMIWAANLYLVWWCVPRLVGSWSLDQRISFVASILVVCVLGCLLLHPVVGFREGRFRGMFSNSTFSGRFLAIACITWITLFVASSRRRPWLLFMGPLSLFLLLMTRTRASIAACALGSAVVLLLSASSHKSTARSKAANIIGVSLVLCAFLVVLAPAFLDKDRVAQHLRVEGGVNEVLSARLEYWQRGYDEIWTHGLFGNGFLSKFGNTDNSRIVMGIVVPQYDWTLTADPHNMFFTTSQQIGIPAAIVLAIIVWRIFQSGRRVGLQGKSMVWGWVTAGLVFGCIDGNWLITFGDPIDRVSMLAFAIIISAPAPAVATNRPPRAQDPVPVAKSTNKTDALPQPPRVRRHKPARVG